MELERFGKFTLLIDNISKAIHKIKIDTVPYLGIKSVHVFWIYNLYTHPEGLTATEIAANRQIDRSLVSREIAELCSDGYIKYVGGTGKRRNYNTRIVLTEKGRELAHIIWHEAMDIQTKADIGVTDEELELFYSVTEKLHANLVKIAKERELEFVEKGESKIKETEKSSD